MNRLPFDPRSTLYAVIPASVRYDPELTASAKLLYGEISALAQARGYCFAQNRYFAELYRLSVKTISSLISALADRGHVRIEVIKTDKGEVKERRIWLIKERDYLEGGTPENTEGVSTENGRGYPENSGGGIPKNVKEINTRVNDTSVNKPPIVPHEIRDRFAAFAGEDEALLAALLGFAEMRAKKKKPLFTDRSVTLLLNKLDRFSGGDGAVMVSLLDEATEKGWSSVFLHEAGPRSGGDRQEAGPWKETLEEW